MSITSTPETRATRHVVIDAIRRGGALDRLRDAFGADAPGSMETSDQGGWRLMGLHVPTRDRNPMAIHRFLVAQHTNHFLAAPHPPSGASSDMRLVHFADLPMRLQGSAAHIAATAGDAFVRSMVHLPVLPGASGRQADIYVMRDVIWIQHAHIAGPNRVTALPDGARIPPKVAIAVLPAYVSAHDARAGHARRRGDLAALARFLDLVDDDGTPIDLVLRPRDEAI